MRKLLLECCSWWKCSSKFERIRRSNIYANFLKREEITLDNDNESSRQEAKESKGRSKRKRI